MAQRLEGACTLSVVLKLSRRQLRVSIPARTTHIVSVRVQLIEELHSDGVITSLAEVTPALEVSTAYGN